MAELSTGSSRTTENPGFRRPGLTGRSVNRLQGRSFASHWNNAEAALGFRRDGFMLPLPEHQVVAMNHLAAAGISEDQLDIGRRAALDLVGVGRVVGDQAAADLRAV